MTRLTRNQPFRSSTVSFVGVVFVVVGVVGCNLPPVEDPSVGWSTDGYEQFFVGEQAFYTAPIGGCSVETPLTPLADNVRDALVARGWSGVLGEDANDICTMPGHKCTMPADYVEQQGAQPDGLVGQDSFYGDAATLSIFSGHGAHNVMAFRRPSTLPGGSDVCQLLLSDRVRLGRLGGGRTRVAAFAASCVGYAADLQQGLGADDFRDALGESNSWQYLAFHDSPTLDLLMFPNFIALLDQGSATNTSWIDAMEFDAPMTYNQPIVYTTYNAVTDAAMPFDYLGTRHELSNLLTGAELPSPAPTMYTAFMYTYSLSDGNPNNNDPLPSDCIDNIPNN